MLFFSRPNWQTWGASLRYAPHTAIRSVAVYGGRIEYDVRFPTNNLGLIDARDYARAPAEGRERRFACVGDSFAAGFHGGSPWLPRLRDRAQARDPRVELYNLGVGATGFAQFALNLAALDRELDFGRVVVLFITDDLRRATWRPIERGGRLILCPSRLPAGECAASPAQPIHVLEDPSLPAAELLASLDEGGSADRFASTLRRLLGGSWAAFGIAAGLGAHAQPSAPAPPDDVGPLQELARSLPDRAFLFLHIPEKDETRRGRHRVDLAAGAAAGGLHYVSLLGSCGFEISDYFEADGHFNAAGYEKLLGCVGRELGLI